MNGDYKKRLIDAAYDIIRDERLPKPGVIKFLSPFRGTKHRRGTCFHKVSEDKFKIIIYTRIANFVEDENGTHINKKSGKRMRQLSVGKDLDIDKIKDTLAHEIAHLKFWKHDAQHTSYTNHILEKIERVCP